MNDSVLAALALSQTPKIGPVTFRALLETHGTADQALLAVHEDERFKEKPSLEKAKKFYEQALKQGVTVISIEEERYPFLLKQVKDPPPVLFAKGNLGLFKRKGVAIVGARNASYAGQKLAYGLAKDLVKNGYMVTSGFARGIDHSAHKGAQEKGSIAVFAGGIDYIFPPEYEGYVEPFLETGLIVSEMPMGYQPTNQNFPRRNRLISGLSQAVVVVEAAHQSGSLLTADYAMAQGREVGAVPGSPLDARCRGTNKLLRDGAHFVENSWDIFSFLNDLQSVGQAQKAAKKQKQLTAENELEEKILTLLSYSSIDLNDLLRQIPTETPMILEALSLLELSGKIIRGAGNEVALRPH